jgi:hypothetical protein
LRERKKEQIENNKKKGSRNREIKRTLIALIGFSSEDHRGRALY